MITKNHPSAYSELFAKAQKVLSQYGGTDFKNAEIKNIDDYFACLKELARIEADHTEIDPIFTILPATEEMFEIDANTRQIKIPDNFIKYGVAVKGDEIAEILYFSIDRYFDAMDLAAMEIIVQWKHEKSEAHISNLSATYKKSLTLQPGKIIFGWPITKEVTAESGNINFSIRFYHREVDANNHESLKYSFSTLTSAIKIQNGLDFTLNEHTLKQAINKNSLIYDNLRNSKKANPEGYVITMPNFTDYYLLDSDNNLVKTDPANNLYDLPATFVVKAAIAPKENEWYSGTGLTYTWYKKIGEDVSDNDEPQNNNNMEHFYVPLAEDAEYDKNEVYYEKIVEGETTVYVPYTAWDEDLSDEGVQLYTRHSAFAPSIAGTYYNKVVNSYAIGLAEVKDSKLWVVPGASSVEFTYPMNDYQVELNSEEEVELEIVPNEAVGGITTMKWCKYTDEEKEQYVEIEDETESKIVVTEEGKYFMIATNTRNADNVDSISNPISVYYLPCMPIIQAYSPSGTVGKPITVQAVCSNEKGAGELSYAWYNYVSDDQVVATDKDFTPDSPGSYKCYVTNTYANNISEAVSTDWITVGAPQEED